MVDLIIKSFYFALPAYVANMAPVIFDKFKILKSLARPIDNNQKLGRESIFGSSKTWRGLISAVIFGLVVAFIQSQLYNYDFWKSISIINYPNNFIVFGFLAGLGAIIGDLLKSFFKRRIGLKSGSTWPVFDQLDFILGFFIFTYLIVSPPTNIIITVFIITLILHPLTNLISYLIGFKKVWW